jgi:glycosidase
MATSAPFPEVVIEPPYWWSGMRNPKLLLFVTGPSIATFTPTVDSPSARLERFLPMESPQYAALFLDIADAPPHEFSIHFASPTFSFTKPYELKRRTASALPDTVSSSDVLYLFMPDRFSRGHYRANPPVGFPSPVDRTDPDARHGGDLAGVRARLPYFADLGVTCLWPTPLFENDINGGSYHGYSITNFFNIDPRFGTNEDFFALVSAAHSLNLKVIADMVFNHCGGTHPWAFDPPTADWFHFPGAHMQAVFDTGIAYHAYGAEIDRESLQDFEFTIEMPDLNQKNPILAQYLVQSSIWWVEAAHLNGIRMDTFAFCDQEMMRDWGIAMDAEFPGIFLLGEVWKANTAGEAWFQRGNPLNALSPSLPAVMDFSFMKRIHKFFRTPDGLSRLYKHFGLDFLYPDVFRVLRFVENHDTDRFLDQAPANLAEFKKAMLVLLTVPGIPQFYYGTELLMWGQMRPTDGNVRKDFPGGWPADAENWFEPAGRKGIAGEAFDFLAKLLHWRQGKDAISRGKMVMFRPRRGYIAYERTCGESTVVVVINGERSVTVDAQHLREATRERVQWVDVISGKQVTLAGSVALAPDAVLLLEPAH